MAQPPPVRGEDMSEAEATYGFPPGKEFFSRSMQSCDRTRLSTAAVCRHLVCVSSSSSIFFASQPADLIFFSFLISCSPVPCDRGISCHVRQLGEVEGLHPCSRGSCTKYCVRRTRRSSAGTRTARAGTSETTRSTSRGSCRSFTDTTSSRLSRGSSTYTVRIHSRRQVK